MALSGGTCSEPQHEYKYLAYDLDLFCASCKTKQLYQWQIILYAYYSMSVFGIHNALVTK